MKGVASKVHGDDSIELCSAFFTEIEVDNFKCICGVDRKKTNGWTNLKSHILDKHKDWPEVLK